MRSALRTSAGPQARYAACGSSSVADSTLNADGRARPGYEVALDRTIRARAARAAIVTHPALAAAAAGARAVRVGAARAAGCTHACTGLTDVGADVRRRAVVVVDLDDPRGPAQRAAAVRRAPAARAQLAIVAMAARALGVGDAVLGNLARARG